MHFYALAIYAVCVAGYECSMLWDKLRDERRFRLSRLTVPIRCIDTGIARPGIERAGTLGLGAVVGTTDLLGLYCQVEGRSADLANLFPPGFRKTVARSPVCD